MRRLSAFEHGLEVSFACNGVLVVALYAVVAFTRDIRARIPFLVGIAGPVEIAIAFAVTSVCGLLGLAVARGWSKQSVIGALAGAAASLVFLASGEGDHWIPADYESSPKYGLLAVAIIVAVALLWHARRRSTHANPPPNEEL